MADDFKKLLESVRGDAKPRRREADEVEELLSGQHGEKIRKFFGAIKKAEGGQPDIIVGGKQRFDVTKDHPNIVGLRTKEGPSTAAGDYQITGTNWYGNKKKGIPGLKDRLRANDFGPENQLRAALLLFKDRNKGAGLNALLNDDYDTALSIAKQDWAALPGSDLHKGRNKRMSRDEFLKHATGKAPASFSSLLGDIRKNAQPSEFDKLVQEARKPAPTNPVNAAPIDPQAAIAETGSWSMPPQGQEISDEMMADAERVGLESLNKPQSPIDVGVPAYNPSAPVVPNVAEDPSPLAATAAGGPPAGRAMLPVPPAAPIQQQPQAVQTPLIESDDPEIGPAEGEITAEAQAPTGEPTIDPEGDPNAEVRRVPYSPNKPENVSSRDWMIDDVATALAQQGVNFQATRDYLKRKGFRDLTTGAQYSDEQLADAYAGGNQFFSVTNQDLAELTVMSGLYDKFDEGFRRGLLPSQIYQELGREGYLDAETAQKYAVVEDQKQQTLLGELADEAQSNIVNLPAMDVRRLVKDRFTTEAELGKGITPQQINERIRKEATERFSQIIKEYKTVDNYKSSQALAQAKMQALKDRREELYQMGVPQFTVPLQVVSNIAQSASQVMTDLVKFTDIVQEFAALPTASDIYRTFKTGEIQNTPAYQRTNYQTAQAWQKWFETNAYNDEYLNTSVLLNDLPKTLTQLGIQMAAGAMTGGAAAPALIGGAQGAAGAYEDAVKGGATANERRLAVAVAFSAAIPEYVLMGGMLKSSGLVKEQVLDDLLSRTTRQLFTRFAAEVGEVEAKELTRSALAGMMAKVSRGAGNTLKYGSGEAIQETIEGKLNNAVAAYTYDKTDSRWNKVAFLTNDDLKTIGVSFLAGAAGYGAGAALNRLQTPSTKIQIDGKEYDTPTAARPVLQQAISQYQTALETWEGAKKLFDAGRRQPTQEKRREYRQAARNAYERGTLEFQAAEEIYGEAQKLATDTLQTSASPLTPMHMEQVLGQPDRREAATERRNVARATNVQVLPEYAADISSEDEPITNETTQTEISPQPAQVAANEILPDATVPAVQEPVNPEASIETPENSTSGGLAQEIERPKQFTPPEPIGNASAGSTQTDTVVVKPPRPDEAIPVDKIGGAISGGIKEGLYNHLWGKVENGDTTELGKPSALLQIAKAIRDNGGLQTREELQQLGNDWGAVANNPERQKAAHDLVRKYSPKAQGAKPVERVPITAQGIQLAERKAVTPKDTGFEIVGETGQKGIGVARLKELRDAEKRKAETSAVTGLPNKSAFKQAQPRIEADPNREITTIDLNKFKAINDENDHLTGDKALNDAGNDLLESAKKVAADAQVFHLSGDEFLIDSPTGTGQQILAAADQVFSKRKYGTVQGSIGGSTAQTYEAAEAGLQQAKAERKARGTIPADAKTDTGRTAPGGSAGNDTRVERGTSEKGDRKSRGKAEKARTSSTSPTELKDETASSLVRNSLAKLRQKKEAEKPAEDDAFADLDALLGVTQKAAVLPEQPFYQSKYDKFKPALSKAFQNIEGPTYQDRVDAFVEKLNERYSLEQLEQLEPYLVRFVDENVLTEPENESIEEVDDTTVDQSQDREDGTGEQLPDDGGRADQGLDSGQSGEAEGLGIDGESDTADAKSDAGTGRRPGSKGGRGKSVDGGPRDPADGRDTAARSNYRIGDELDFERFSPKDRFRKNINAIKLINQLDEEGRAATAEEQKVLAQYVGWGGLKQAFDKNNDKWAKEYTELRELLPDGEYEKARRSILNSHYTSKAVVSGIWKGLERIGFKGGKVLEPSMGTGNFFGLMPAAIGSHSALTGVELEPITSKIAKHLYPKAMIHGEKGFQEVYIPPDSFDVAIGNPPFGDEKLFDKNSKELSKLRIHAYFFAKSVDALRPGGVLAMVVSKGFMDSRAPEAQAARDYVAKKAKLIGAIRLPDTAFQANANTEVTTDIVFLQRKNTAEDKQYNDWTDIAYLQDKETGQPIPVNRYFAENPDMMLGEMTLAGSMYRANEPTLTPPENQDIEADLAEAIAKLPENIFENRTEEITDRLTNAETKTLDDYKGIRPYNYGIGKAGQIFQLRTDENGRAFEVAVPLKEAQVPRVKGMIELRGTIRQILSMESNETTSDAELAPLREQLNQQYDKFQKKFGYISSDTNKRLMRNDADYPLLQALEKDYDRGISKERAVKEGVEAREPSATKADVFTKRTVSPVKPVTSVDNAADALIASMNQRGRMDLSYMSHLYGKPEGEIIQELGDKVYDDPQQGWVTSDEYLSGDVKTKYEQAKEAAEGDPKRFNRNADALEKVIPADIEPVDIFVRIGSSWVPTDIYQQFVADTIGGSFQGSYIQSLGKFVGLEIRSSNATLNTDRWGTKSKPAASILKDLISNKQPQVFRPAVDENGRTRTNDNGDPIMVVDQEETAAAQGKAEALMEEFEDWIWRDRERRERLKAMYNERFNRRVLRNYDGSHLVLPGLSRAMQLRPHIRNFIYRTLQSGKALADHVVGAGKTPTAIATAMEMRRLGMAKKPMFTVPNHLVEQWALEFKKFYPGANVLAATRKDFEKGNRRALFAKIATGDWDAVVVAHSSFQFIPLPLEVEQEFLGEQIAELQSATDEARRAEGKTSRSVRDMEKAQQRLEDKFKRLADVKRDDLLNFGEMGVDALFVDEAHEYKNLFFTTQKQGVGSLGDPAGSQKAFDMFMKTQMILRQNNDRNVVFLTGTPVSNSLAEIFHMQRYLQYDTLKKMGIANFDAWANTFGQDVQDWELNAAGKFRQKLRFVKFANLPELKQLWQEVADTITNADIKKAAEDAGETFKIPQVRKHKVIAKPSENQLSYIGQPQTRYNYETGEPELDADGLPVTEYSPGTIVYRMENWMDIQKNEDPKENVLRITNDARKAGLDYRLISPNAQDFEGSKINLAVDNIFGKWEENADRKGTQLVFLDLSTPKKKRTAAVAPAPVAEDADNVRDATLEDLEFDMNEFLAASSSFSAYEDMREKLIEKGIPANEIAFIHDYETDLQKAELFAKVNRGDVRVLFGSTKKMGAGSNVQKKLVALHNIDVPWKPSDLEQRNGRIIRQGNEFWTPEFTVDIYDYATEKTYDARMWEIVEQKGTALDRFKTSDAREVEDVSPESANAAEMKASATGDPRILESITLKAEIKKLESQKKVFDRSKYDLESKVVDFERGDTREQIRNERFKEGVQLHEAKKDEDFIEFGGERFDLAEIQGEKADDGKREQARASILRSFRKALSTEAQTEVGKFRGFTLVANPRRMFSGTSIDLQLRYNGVPLLDSMYSDTEALSADFTGTMRRITHMWNALPQKAETAAKDLAKIQAEYETAKQQKDAEFPKLAELTEKKQRSSDLLKELRAAVTQKSVADEAPEERKTIEQLQAMPYEPIESVIAKAEVEVVGSTIRSNVESAELYRRTREEAGIRAKRYKRGGTEFEDMIRGEFYTPEAVRETAEILREKATEANDLGYSPEEVKVFNDHADALENAAKAGQGTAIVFVLDAALPEEIFHQTDYLNAADKSLLNRHTPEIKKKLDSHKVREILWARHFSKFGTYTRKMSDSNRNALLRAEIPPYLLDLSDKQLKNLGITPEQRTEYLTLWFEGYAAKNGIEALDAFEREELNVQEFIEQVKASASKQNVPAGEKDEADIRKNPSGQQGEVRRGPPSDPGDSGNDRDTGSHAGDLGGNEKWASLPATLRRAGIEAEDFAYEVFGDAAALDEARQLINDNGIEGTLKILDNVGQLDVHHAMASFIIQRMLRDRADQLEAKDAAEAANLRAYAREVGQKHVLNSIAAGRYTRAASVIPTNVEGVMFTFQKAVQDIAKGERTLSPERWEEIEAMGRDLEEKDAKLQSVLKERGSLKRRIKRLEDELEGKRKERRSAGSDRRRKALVALVQKAKKSDVDAARERLKARFAGVTLKSIVPPKTDAFKKWFGDSKVVDADGKPLRVYRGDTYSKGIDGREAPYHFTDSTKVASGYTESRHLRGGDGPNMTPAYLSMQNPLILDALGARHDNIPVPWEEWKPKVFGNLPEGSYTVDRAYHRAIIEGYDGLIVKNVVDTLDLDDKTKSTVYVASKATQIKSAIGNRGTFDPNEPSILKSVLEPDEKFPLDDLAAVGADMLTEGIAQEEPYLPEHFEADLIAEFGGEVRPYFNEIYRRAWELRDQWMADVRKEEQFEAVRRKYGEFLEDWEVEEILGEKKERAAKRRAIESIHKLASKGQRQRADLGAYAKIISNFDDVSDNAAVAAMYFADNQTRGKVTEKMEAAGITGKELRAAVREGEDAFNRAKKMRNEQKDATANEILAASKELKLIDDMRWTARNEARKSVQRLADELKRIKRGEFGYRAGQVWEFSNVFRTMMASFDLSAVMRQGGFFVLSTPEKQWKAAANMLKSITDKGYGRAILEIERHPLFVMAQRAGIDFAMAGKSEGNYDLMGEELYKGEQTIEKIPILGKLVANLVVKPSERTYTAFLDTQRMIMFAVFARELQDRKLSLRDNKEAFEAIAKFINVGTGRGTVPKGKLGTIIMNLPLFAPRYTISRLQLLNMTLNPVAYARLPKYTRRIVARKAVRFYGMVAGIMGIAALLGASINWDPDDDDFLKITVGNAKYDLFAGLLPPAKLIIKTVHSAIRTKGGTDNRIEGEIFYDTANALLRFTRGKLSPLASLAADVGTGRDYVGNKTELLTSSGDLPVVGEVPLPGKAIYSRLIPLMFNEIYEAYKLDGGVGIAKSVPATMFGVGVSTYKPRPERPETEAEKLAAKFAASNFSGSSKLEKEQRELRNELTARSRKGEDVYQEVDQRVEDGTFTEWHKRDILAAATKTLLIDKAEGLSLEQLERVFEEADANEAQQLIPLMSRKAKDKDVEGQLKPDLRKRLVAIGVKPLGDIPMPETVQYEFDLHKIRKPDVGDKLTLTKGGPKTKLDHDRYAEYRAEVLANAYKQVEEVIKTKDYRDLSPEQQKQLLERIIRGARTQERKRTKAELLTTP